MVLWALIAAARRHPSWRRITAAAVVSLLVNGIWLVVAAGAALGYLGEIVQSALQSLAAVAAEAPPPGRSSVRLWVLVCRPSRRSLPRRGPRSAAGRPRRRLVARIATAPRATLGRGLPRGCSGLPATLALRFTGAGAETSQRASEFLYLGVAWLVADALVHLVPGRRAVSALAVTAMAIVLASGIIVGTVWFVRMPGPYHVAAEQLSIEPQVAAAAAWALANLGRGNRLIADRTNQKLFGSWGAQNPVTAYNSHLGTAFVMWEDGLSDDDLRVLQEGGIDFVLADLRTTRNLPVYPYYYEQAEPEAGSHRTPWPLGGSRNGRR